MSVYINFSIFNKSALEIVITKQSDHYLSQIESALAQNWSYEINYHTQKDPAITNNDNPNDPVTALILVRGIRDDVDLLSILEGTANSFSNTLWYGAPTLTYSRANIDERSYWSLLTLIVKGEIQPNIDIKDDSQGPRIATTFPAELFQPRNDDDECLLSPSRVSYLVSCKDLIKNRIFSYNALYERLSRATFEDVAHNTQQLMHLNATYMQHCQAAQRGQTSSIFQ